jgi:hypothetical protein
MDDLAPRSKRRKGGSSSGNGNGGHGDPPRGARERKTATESDLLANALEALHKGEFGHRLRPRDGVSRELADSFNNLAERLDHTAVELARLTRVVGRDGEMGERMRKIDDTTIEAQMVIEDPAALKSPWRITKRYRRVPAGTRAYDYSCAENNRNPVSPAGRTLTLGSDGKPIDKVVD